mgnify:CR=1 FL=1
MTTHEIDLDILNSLNIELRVQVHEDSRVGQDYIEDPDMLLVLEKSVKAAKANETHVWVDLEDTGRPVGRLVTDEEGDLSILFFGTRYEEREAGLC